MNSRDQEDHDQNQGVFHERVGSALFEYAHREGTAMHRYSFNMKVGDNPDFWKAKLLMPGAQFLGICHGAFDGDTGAVRDADCWPVFNCCVRVGRSVFFVAIPARSLSSARVRCREIGTLVPDCDAPPSALTRLRCILRFFWLRRPTIRLRSPLDIFGH